MQSIDPRYTATRCDEQKLLELASGLFGLEEDVRRDVAYALASNPCLPDDALPSLKRWFSETKDLVVEQKVRERLAHFLTL
jgi:hypothetical protein